MNKFILMFLLMLVTAGCAFNGSDSPLLLTAAKGIAQDQSRLDYAVMPFHPAAFPVTLDRMMLIVRDEACNSVPERPYSFQVKKDSFLATQFNLYAAEKIHSGAEFDCVAEREAFFESKCGKASMPFILDYLRLLERRTVYPFWCSGLLGPDTPKLYDIYDTAMLDKLQTVLESAVNAASDTPYASALNAEYKLFIEQRKKIEKSINDSLPVFYAGRKDNRWQNFTGILGDPVDFSTSAICTISDDRKAMIIRVRAYEPEMEKRVVTGFSRDYNLAWKDDRIEFFIVSDRSATFSGECRQFILTSGGVLWDSRISGFHKGDPTWNSTAVFFKNDADGFWEAELTIPFADFGFDGVPDVPFRMNIYRYRVVKGKKETGSAWVPRRYGQNFQPEFFGKILWN